MPNLLLKIKYDGTEYHGWQVQANAITVQQKVQDAVEKIYGNRIDIKGCSRTDAGVHAAMYCFSFKAPYYKDAYHTLSAFNSYLPSDIRAFGCMVVPDDFHARYSCTGKEYIYYIYDAKFANPFIDKYVYHSKKPIDENLLNTAAKSFIGTHDFKSFCTLKRGSDDTVRTIYDFSVIRRGDFVILTVSGNGFLYNMVRIMVGTLLRVNSGKISVSDLPDIISSKNRDVAGQTAPAKGLFLNRVFYREVE